jgi:hypothetical protein
VRFARVTSLAACRDEVICVRGQVVVESENYSSKFEDPAWNVIRWHVVFAVVFAIISGLCFSLVVLYQSYLGSLGSPDLPPAVKHPDSYTLGVFLSLLFAFFCYMLVQEVRHKMEDFYIAEHAQKAACKRYEDSWLLLDGMDVRPSREAAAAPARNEFLSREKERTKHRLAQIINRLVSYAWLTAFGGSLLRFAILNYQPGNMVAETPTLWSLLLICPIGTLLYLIEARRESKRLWRIKVSR